MYLFLVYTLLRLRYMVHTNGWRNPNKWVHRLWICLKHCWIVNALKDEIISNDGIFYLIRMILFCVLIVLFYHASLFLRLCEHGVIYFIWENVSPFWWHRIEILTLLYLTGSKSCSLPILKFWCKLWTPFQHKH